MTRRIFEGAPGAAERLDPPLKAADGFPAGISGKRICLLPGELVSGRGPVVVTTVLGSCVSATMLCRRLASWAVCHAVLPKGSDPDPEGYCRYADESIRRMSDWFRRQGAKPREIEVKLFGGAEILIDFDPGARFVPVGRSNVETALAAMASENLRLLASDVGGYAGRKLFFSSSTGDVILKRLRGAVE